MIDYARKHKEERIIARLSQAQWHLNQHLKATEHPDHLGTKNYPAVKLYDYELREILKLISACKRELQ